MGPSARHLRRHLCAAVAALLLVACDAGGANPFASFEDRCGKLPPSRFQVATIPITYVQDDVQSIDELTLKSGHVPGRHLTFGITTVNFGHQTQIEIHSVEDRAGARACGTVGVDVSLSMQPVHIHLAQELESSACARNATMEHELMHVAVFREVLDDAAAELAADMAGAIGTGVHRASSQAALQLQLNARVNDYLAGFMQRRKRDMDERQARVDSPEEYARVTGACGH